jgi:hypothetical protein
MVTITPRTIGCISPNSPAISLELSHGSRAAAALWHTNCLAFFGDFLSQKSQVLRFMSRGDSDPIIETR